MTKLELSINPYCSKNHSKQFAALKKKHKAELKFIMVRVRNMELLENYYTHQEIKLIINLFQKRLSQFKNYFTDYFALNNETHLLVLSKDQTINAFEGAFVRTMEHPIVKKQVNTQVKVTLSSYNMSTVSTPLNEVITYLKRAQVNPQYDTYKDISEYTVEYEKEISKKHQIIEEMLEIIHKENKEERIIIHFQPIINFKTFTINTFEALVRIESKKFGILTPDEFIPLAEKQGIIGMLATYILRTSFVDFNKLRIKHPNTKLNINVSPHELSDEMYINKLETLRSDYNIDASDIGIEITEGVFMQNKEIALKILNDLRSKGYRIVLDDFGTGYSSLAYLLELPLTDIKIDKRFTARVLESRNYEIFLSGIIFTIRSLGLNVIAEGIETQEQSSLITQIGANEGQGFLYAKPAPHSTFTNPQLTNS